MYNSRTLLRSSTVVNYDVDRIDANIGGALLCRGPQRAARRKWPTLTDPSTPTYLVVEIIVVEILILSQPNGRTHTQLILKACAYACATHSYFCCT